MHMQEQLHGKDLRIVVALLPNRKGQGPLVPFAGIQSILATGLILSYIDRLFAVSLMQDLSRRSRTYYVRQQKLLEK